MRNVDARSLLLGMAIAIVFGLIGQDDYTQAKAEQARYCKNIEAGIWYDSEENIRKKCKTGVDDPLRVR